MKALQRFYMDLCEYCIAIIAGNRPSQGVNICPVRALTPVQALISVNAWIEKINALTESIAGDYRNTILAQIHIKTLQCFDI